MKILVILSLAAFAVTSADLIEKPEANEIRTAKMLNATVAYQPWARHRNKNSSSNPTPKPRVWTTRSAKTKPPPTNTRGESSTDPDEYIQPKDKEDQFDWELSQESFRASSKQNVIISPVSVKILLIFLAEAAAQDVESDTRTQLEKVLANRKTLNDTRDYYSKVYSSLQTKHALYTVNIGSKIFVKQGTNLSQKYKSILDKHYNTIVEILNFQESEKSASIMNKWIEEVTNGKIASLVDSESLSSAVMVLLNAIYFRGLWRYPFEEVVRRDFATNAHSKGSKEFAEITESFYYYYSKDLQAKILRLPYEGGRYSMFLLLPFENDGLDLLIENLDSAKIEKEVDRMEEIRVHVMLPKFKFDTSSNLNDAIKKIGITEIFNDSATFPMFTASAGTKIKVSNIIQKAGIVVDEKGSEAYAATEIELIDKFGGDPREFVADHPFMFYIEDDTTGAKLFTGIVNDPEY